MAEGLVVSIVVLNYNGKEYLERYFESLLKINYPNTELILVDNGSTDGSVEFMREKFPSVIIVTTGKNLGCGGGFNAGMQQAKGDILVNLANDTAVHPEFANELVKIFQSDKKIGACVCKILHPDGKILDSAGDYLTISGFLFHRGNEEADHGQFDRVEDLFAGKGTAIAFKASVLREVGMFDSDMFVFFEDADLCWRIHLAGYRIVFVPQSIVYHYFGGVLGKTPKAMNDYHAFKNRILSLIKNLSFSRLFLVLLLHIMFCLGVVGFYFIKRNFQNGFAILRAISWNFSHLPYIWKKRREVQYKIRKVPNREFMPRVQKKFDSFYFLRLLNNYCGSWTRFWKAT